MNAKIVTRLSVLALATAFVAGCASNGQGANTGIGAGVGTAIGAIAGDLLGGGQGAEMGALAGAAAGAAAGYGWQDIFGAAKDTGVQASQQPDGSLKVNIPSDISFAKGGYALSVSSGSLLDKIGAKLVQNPGMIAHVTGFSDSSGSLRANQKISEQRASAVADYLSTYLKGRGVSPIGRVFAEGLGSNNPVASNNTANGRAQNRRVEIVVSGPAQSPQSAQGVQQVQ